jgi:hypothetical protein
MDGDHTFQALGQTHTHSITSADAPTLEPRCHTVCAAEQGGITESPTIFVFHSRMIGSPDRGLIEKLAKVKWIHSFTPIVN